MRVSQRRSLKKIALMMKRTRKRRKLTNLRKNLMNITSQNQRRVNLKNQKKALKKARLNKHIKLYQLLKSSKLHFYVNLQLSSMQMRRLKVSKLLRRRLKRRFKKSKDRSRSQRKARDRNQMEKKNQSLMVDKNLRVRATKRMNLKFKESRMAFTASTNLRRVMSQNGAITAAAHTTTAQPPTFIMARPAHTLSLQTMVLLLNKVQLINLSSNLIRHHSQSDSRLK
jgi:hypothetical protein